MPSEPAAGAPSHPAEDLLDGDTQWQARDLSTLPHVRKFLAETEYQIAGAEASSGSDVEPVLGPAAGLAHPGLTVTHHSRTSHMADADREDRAAAGTVGIDPRRSGVQSRRHMTGGQRLGGLLLAVACVGAAVWYVPRIVASDEHSLTGTVTSTGVIDLNFAKAGQLNEINVRMGQQVSKGATLASEYDPATEAVVTADKAAIAADNAKLAELHAEPVSGQQAAIAAENALLDKDQAQLDTDQASLFGTRIVASKAGTVVAVNGQPGETVSSLGVRDYTSDSGATAAGVEPEFSLLPEGPQSSIKSTGSESELPVIALRVSDSWEVVILVPESSISAVKARQKVTISVPAAGITGVRGEIEEVLPTPQSTQQGVAYQAVATVFGYQANAPLSGMSANVELQS